MKLTPFRVKILKSALNRKRKKFNRQRISGERISISRVNQPDIRVNRYYPSESSKNNLPVIIQVHGGAWLAGESESTDSLCRYLADTVPAIVFGINYKKLDEEPFPYPQNEIADLVEWVKSNAEEIGADGNRITLLGQSAGAHLCASAALLLKDKNISVANNILVYPFTDFSIINRKEEFVKLAHENNYEKLKDGDGSTIREVLDLLGQFIDVFTPDADVNDIIISPGNAKPEELKGLGPTHVITCGQDILKYFGEEYYKKLCLAGVKASFKEYPDAVHGFLETNRIEQKDNKSNNPQQDAMARDCERLIVEIVKNDEVVSNGEI